MITQTKYSWWGKALLPVITAMILGVGLSVNAAVLELEQFDTDAAGWGDRDGAEMAVSYNGGFGNAAGSMQGTFADQGDAPVPETDAFRLTSGPFMGDLTLGSTYDPTAFIFDFYSAHVLPSDLIIRIGDGVNTFFRGLTSLVPGVGGWGSVSASLSFAGWFGGSQAQFDAVLESVSFIELQITRSGAGEQTYYFDNFSYHAEEADENGGGNGGGPSAVPEPSTINLLILVGMFAIGLRRYHVRNIRNN